LQLLQRKSLKANVQCWKAQHAMASILRVCFRAIKNISQFPHIYIYKFSQHINSYSQHRNSSWLFQRFANSSLLSSAVRTVPGSMKKRKYISRINLNSFPHRPLHDLGKQVHATNLLTSMPAFARFDTWTITTNWN
jgi:hypothetical protein